MSKTARLKLPLMHSGQAQKEITHNEALTLLDALVSPVVQEIDVMLPPQDAKAGDLYMVGSNPEGKFAKHENEIAAKLEIGWRFIAPTKWQEIILDFDGSKYRFDGQNWASSNNSIVAASQIPTQSNQIQSNYLIKKDTGEYLQVLHLEEEVLVLGAHIDTAIKIPHHSVVIAVSVRVIETITGATTFSVGVEGAANKYGNNLSPAKDTTNLGLTNYPQTYWSDTTIRLTASGGSFTNGKVKISIQLLKPHGCWNWD